MGFLLKFKIKSFLNLKHKKSNDGEAKTASFLKFKALIQSTKKNKDKIWILLKFKAFKARKKAQKKGGIWA